MAKVRELTLGLEYEMIKANPRTRELIERHSFGLRSDSSIQDSNGQQLAYSEEILQAIELVTPIYEVPVNWESLDPVASVSTTELKALISCSDSVNSSCGVHLHIGKPCEELTSWNPNRLLRTPGGKLSRWTKDEVYTWLMAGLYLEKAGIFEAVPKSRKSESNAKIKERYSRRDLYSGDPIGEVESRKYNNDKRYCWINTIETKRKKANNERRVGYAASEGLGTIEIRLLGETKDYDYVNTWCNFWIKIAAIIASYPTHKALMMIMSSEDVTTELVTLKNFAEVHEITYASSYRSRVTHRHHSQVTSEAQ